MGDDHWIAIIKISCSQFLCLRSFGSRELVNLLEEAFLVVSCDGEVAVLEIEMQAEKVKCITSHHFRWLDLISFSSKQMFFTVNTSQLPNFELFGLYLRICELSYCFISKAYIILGIVIRT